MNKKRSKNLKTKEELKFFLSYGYFPNYSPKFKPQKVGKINVDYKSYRDLQSQFYKVFSKVIKDMVSNIPAHKSILIPLSGGLDSRAILAGVLEFVEPTRIKTYTFGAKGSYDFEIGKEVAKKAGVHHDAIELNSIRFSQEEMLEVAKKCDYQTHLFHHPPLSKLHELIGDGIVVSGYLGDVIFGSYADKTVSNKESVNWYLKTKKYSSYFKNQDTNLFKNYIEPFDENSIVPPFEQLILYERAPKLIAPHILMNGWEYEFPLIDKRILDFMYSIPNKFRRQEKLFIDTMLTYYPSLFNIRAKTTFGQHLKSPKLLILLERLKNKTILKLNYFLNIYITYPPYNYIDFNKEILRRPDLKLIFETNLKDLEARNILDSVEPTKILQDHRKKKNLSNILILLVSLELILKAKEQ